MREKDDLKLEEIEMNINFAEMNEKHQKEVMRIFNYYIENSTAAFPSKALPEQFFSMLVKKSEGYPSYTVLDKERVIGFCQLSAYNPFPTFSKTACLTYFIENEYTGKGIGSLCLKKLEDEAQKMNISHLVAEISSENNGSISFHKKHGYSLVGELHDIGEKFGREFGIVYMQKTL